MVFHLIAQISEREKVTVFFSEPVAWYKMHTSKCPFLFCRSTIRTKTARAKGVSMVLGSFSTVGVGIGL